MSPSDTNAPDGAQPARPAAQPTGQPRSAGQAPLTVNAQYVKDLSFESPRAPHSLQPNQGQPAINVHVDVQAGRLAESMYEVVLKITANAKLAEQPFFLCELAYGGVFTLGEIPEPQIHPVLLIECPRILFPFARAILSDVTRDGGFPPLLIQPVDFVRLYQETQSRQQATAETIG
jgi:preprotein translocase subunit SecB